MEQRVWWDQPMLFPNQRKTMPNQPDYRGEGAISDELLRELVETRKRGELPKIRIAGWIKDGNRISLKLEKPYVPGQQDRQESGSGPSDPRAQQDARQQDARPLPPPGPTNVYPPRQTQPPASKNPWDPDVPF